MNVMVVTFEQLEPGLFSLTDAPHHFPCYSDSQKRLYRYYGMMKAGFWDLWGPRTLLAYLQLLLKGRKIIPSRGDIQQQGGNVLIDPHGRVRFHYVGSGPADRPDPEVIFALLEKLG